LRTTSLFLSVLLLAGCETLGLAEKPSEPQAAKVAEASAVPAVTGCTVDMAPRWSVAVPGMTSLVVNIAEQRDETRRLPIVVERKSPNQVTFRHVNGPNASADTGTFTASVTKLKSGMCGMTGNFRAFSGGDERTLTMVPLETNRPAPKA
jgi:hypothetical protein